MSRLHSAIAQLLDAEIENAVARRTHEIVDYLRSDEAAHHMFSTFSGAEAARVIVAKYGDGLSRNQEPTT